MSKTIRLYGLLLLTIFSTVGCVEEIDIELPEEPQRIVAVCHFTERNLFRVEVSLSRTLFDNGPITYPEKADVTLSSAGHFLDKLRLKNENGNLFWESADTAHMGIPYSLSVRIAGFDLAEASSFIPIHSRLKKPTINNEAIQYVGLNGDSIALRIPLLLELESVPEKDRFFAFNIQNETELIKYVNGRAVSAGMSIANTSFLADGRTLSLLHNTPEQVVLINENFWSDDRRFIFVNAIVPFDPRSQRPRRLFIEWRTLSEEFYRYHLSLARQGHNLPLADPDAVFNNVNGGYGNFSGYSVRTDTIRLPF